MNIWNLPVTVQADASLRGLGVCLIQNHNGEDQPIAFASKMDVETRYANIERELLAIIFACQHFSTYLLGRSFIAESDHKPLEMIAMKNLANVPPHLQRMLLKLQRYNVTIKYPPGNEMQLVDALSHCPVRASQEIKLYMRVDYIAFTKPWIEKLKDSTRRDPIFRTVYQLTQQGWPHRRRHVPHLAWRYWDFRYKARHAHQRLYMVLSKYSKIQVLPGIPSCRLMKYNKQAIELKDSLKK